MGDAPMALVLGPASPARPGRRTGRSSRAVVLSAGHASSGSTRCVPDRLRPPLDDLKACRSGARGPRHPGTASRPASKPRRARSARALQCSRDGDRDQRLAAGSPHGHRIKNHRTFARPRTRTPGKGIARGRQHRRHSDSQVLVLYDENISSRWASKWPVRDVSPARDTAGARRGRTATISRPSTARGAASMRATVVDRVRSKAAKGSERQTPRRPRQPRGRTRCDGGSSGGDPTRTSRADACAKRWAHPDRATGS